MEDTGLCTSTVSFTGFDAGTVELSLGLHASRQLSDKVLRYLKRVIVTPAVYESFVPLYRVFRYSHWAGISDYTSRFRVAVTYVVIRQLELPGHCDLPDLQAGTPSPEVTGPICRVPLTRLKPTRLSLFS